MNCLSARQLSQSTGVAERTFRHALKTCATGKPWRRHHLPVVQLSDQRGGTGGTTWGLDLTRATPELLAEFPSLKQYLDAAAVPAVAETKPEVDP